MPILMLLYLVFAMTLYSFPRWRHKNTYSAFLLISGLVPMVQAMLQIDEPRLCPACLTFTFVSASYFVKTVKILLGEVATSIAAPRIFRAAMLVVWLSLFLRTTAWAIGYDKSVQTRVLELPHLIGSPLTQFVKSKQLPDPGVLLVVELPGCHVCELAESDLRATRLRWQKVPLCTLLDNQSCFEPGNVEFSAPLLLMCDSHGRIVFQREGWITPEVERRSLLGEIENVQRKWTQGGD